MEEDTLIQIMELFDFRDIIRLKLVCKSFCICINNNPKIFWFKHPIRFYTNFNNCKGCIIENEILPNFRKKNCIIKHIPIHYGLEVHPKQVWILSATRW